jgi:hypothetical protein
MAESELDKLKKVIEELKKQTGDRFISVESIKSIQEAKDAISTLHAVLRDMNSDLDYISKSFKDAVNELSKQDYYLISAKSSLKSISNIASKLVQHKKSESTLSVDEIKKLQHKAKLQFEELKLAKERATLSDPQAKELKSSLSQLDLFNAAAEDILNTEKQINKELGLFGVGLQGAASFMSKLGFGDLSKPFADAIEDTKSAKRELKELEKELKALEDTSNTVDPGIEKRMNAAVEAKRAAENAMVDILNKTGKTEEELLASRSTKYKPLYEQQQQFLAQAEKELSLKDSLISQDQKLRKAQIRLKKAEIAEQEKKTSKYANMASKLKDQLTMVNAVDFIIGQTIKGYFDLNKASVETQRLTGQNLSIQSSLNGRLATSVDYLTTVSELTAETGRNANNTFRSDTIATVAEFKNLLGLSGQEAGNLALITEATGRNLEASTSQLVSQVSSFNRTNKSAISQGKVLKDVANTSESITISLGSNPAKLAQAATQAARLGVSLKEVDAIASSLLDFESSIEAELEAQLLTGKEINLAKAREYALTNQLDKLGQEIFENSADIAEFGQMNRLAQEAYAKSLGMTRDQLARVAYLRGLDAKMTEEQAAAAADVGLEDMKRITSQELLTKSFEKMAQALAGPVDLLASMVAAVSKFSDILVGALVTFTAIKSIQYSLLAYQKAQLVYSSLLQGIAVSQRAAAMGYNSLLLARQAILKGELAKTIGIAAAWAVANPIKALAGLAIAGTVGTLVYSQMKDGIIDPEKGPVVSGEFGTVQLNPKDSIVAGTNLLGGEQRDLPVSSTNLEQRDLPVSSTNLEPLINEIRAMKSELKGILTSIRDKEGNVYLNTDLVGKALVIGATGM